MSKIDVKFIKTLDEITNEYVVCVYMDEILLQRYAWPADTIDSFSRYESPAFLENEIWAIVTQEIKFYLEQKIRP